MDECQATFGGQGEHGDENDPAEQLRVIVLGDAVDDISTESAQSVNGAERGRGDDLDRSRSNAADDDRDGDWYLHSPENLALIRQGLVGVVNEPKGTAFKVRARDIEVAGKTLWLEPSGAGPNAKQVTYKRRWFD